MSSAMLGLSLASWKYMHHMFQYSFAPLSAADSYPVPGHGLLVIHSGIWFLVLINNSNPVLILYNFICPAYLATKPQSS